MKFPRPTQTPSSPENEAGSSRPTRPQSEVHESSPNQARGHIVVVGSLNMDLVATAPRHPEAGETILGLDFHTYPGGKGANQAVAAARMGGQVKMIGRVGQDAFGASLLESLSQAGVDTAYVKVDETTASGVALITVDLAGQNTIVVASGANACLTPEDISAAAAAFQGASVLLLQLESPQPAIQRAIELAQRNRVKIVLNPAPARELDPALLKQVDYLIPNQNEIALLAGIESVSGAASALLSLGVPRLVVTLGEDGVLIFEGQKVSHLPSHPVQVVDTTAAGDAFVGAFAVALSEGYPLAKAAAWGNAAGALAATRVGAQPSLPTRAEFNKFTAHKL